MIPNHKQFIEAIAETKKVCVRFYSNADRGVIDLVCAPLDYAPRSGVADGVNRYVLWDYTSNTGSHILRFLPEQVLDLRVLGEVFSPAEFADLPSPWSVPRPWGAPAEPVGQPMQSPTETSVPSQVAAAVNELIRLQDAGPPSMGTR